MATSNSTNFSITRDTIIARALRILGVLPQGVSATATQISEASASLNGLVKALESDGMPLWGIKEQSITPVASTRVYRIGEGQTVNIPKPLKVIDAFYRHTSSNSDTPLMIITRMEYNALGNKFVTGTPSQIYYDPQRAYGDLYVYPVPIASFASSHTLQIVYQRPFEDFDASGDEPDFPQEWFDAITYLLADRLAPEYGVASEAKNDIKMRAAQIKAEALSFGTEEGSLYFSVNRNG